MVFVRRAATLQLRTPRSASASSTSVPAPTTAGAISSTTVVIGSFGAVSSLRGPGSGAQNTHGGSETASQGRALNLDPQSDGDDKNCLREAGCDALNTHTDNTSLMFGDAACVFAPGDEEWHGVPGIVTGYDSDEAPIVIID